MKDTVVCDECGSGSAVINSRPHGLVVRRRKCVRCGTRWTTIEIKDSDYQKMLKLVDVIRTIQDVKVEP